MTAAFDVTLRARRPEIVFHGAWVPARAASLSVLLGGEILGQTPCNLCWFQRAFVFPLAFIPGIAALRSDASVWPYAVPLGLLGGDCRALSHTALH